MVTIAIELAYNYGLKKKIYFEGVLNDATWHSENSDCLLSPQAYLHHKLLPKLRMNRRCALQYRLLVFF
jgi:hypothetical protein